MNIQLNTDDRKESRTANRRLAQWRVTWLIEHCTSHQLLWYIDSFVLRNPPLRQAQKRYLQFQKNEANEKTPLYFYIFTLSFYLFFTNRNGFDRILF